MLQVIEGNILDFEDGVIFHQVNCIGVMGAGLALQIARKYPIVLDEYENICECFSYPEHNLGGVSATKIPDGPTVVNLFGQIEPGRGKQTNYGALADALSGSLEFRLQGTRYFPYGMACGLAGGNWDVVVEMIEYFYPDGVIVKWN
ncbi:Appr-1-p processing protein [Candidatus Saccharibacteria bacterium]|nr:MAG: Appr-1-p processing protein [Candidatus Saccharibacteria bacterium]